MNDPAQLFQDTLAWLRDGYAQHRFFCERDVVWTVQLHLAESFVERKLSFRVFNDHSIAPRRRRSLTVDIAILAPDNSIEVAAEFKYEPAHERKGVDIWPSKFGPTVVFWGNDGVAGDNLRTQDFVAQGRARFACSVFIDEGGYFQKRYPNAHPHSQWIPWPAGVWILHSQAMTINSNLNIGSNP